MRLFPLIIVGVLLFVPIASAIEITNINQTQVITHDISGLGRLRMNETIRTNSSQYQYGYWNTGTVGILGNASLTAWRNWTLPDADGIVSLMDAGGSTGDIPYASGINTFTRLPIGSSGRILSSTGGAPQWSTTASLSLVDGTGVANRVSYWTDAETLSSDSSVVMDPASDGFHADNYMTATTFGAGRNIQLVNAAGAAFWKSTGDDVGLDGAANTLLRVGGNDVLSLASNGATVEATRALILEPTSSASLPACTEGGKVYDTTNDVFKGGISGSCAYRTFAMLETANTWTAAQNFAGGLASGTTTAGAIAHFVSTGAPGTQSGLLVTSQTMAGWNDGIHIGDRGASSDKFISTYGGKLELQPGGNDIELFSGVDFVLDSSGGTMWGTASTQKQGWWGATPVVRSTWTLTGADLTDNSGGTSGGNTIAAIAGTTVCTGNTCATVASTANAVATLASAVDENTVDIAALKTILQTYGMLN